ncbi:hypothetical protein [Streptomyces inhibens]|uniref:hypothetical protein n=1 Tax=Streptomyces inhibens TaxID=2293571 RepID=UPI001EE7135D|nr:hypothetical protein [Streptomyces inhibens]UKY48216.1 hypothetical protein KI385_04950 [Streptomyces inhibens]
MVSAGTHALLRNGSMVSGTVAMPADSAVFAANPRATVSQPGREAEQHDETARAEPVKGARGRAEYPREGHPDDGRVGSGQRSVVTMTCPVGTAPQETSMTLNRLMTPLVMPEFTAVAVDANP